MTRALFALLLGAALSTPISALADEADQCASAAEQAQSLRDKGKLKEAREGFLRCARETCPKVVAKDCGPWLEDVDKRLPTIVLHARDELGNDLVDVAVTAAGAPLTTHLDGAALPMNPGETTLRFEARGRPAVEQRVVIGEGEKARTISVVLSKTAVTKTELASSSTGLNVAPWVLVGVSAASLATFGALQGVARSELSKAESGCGKTKTCTDQDLNPIRAKFIGSGVAFGLSIATLAAATGIWIFAPRKPGPAPAVSVTPRFGGGSVGAAWDIDL